MGSPKGEQSWSPNAKQWWKSTHADYTLTASELVLAREVCRQVTRLDTLNKKLENAPLTQANRFGEDVPNPLLVEARQISGSLAKLIGSLRLPEITVDDQGQATTGKTPQKRTGARGTYGPYAPAALSVAK